MEKFVLGEGGDIFAPLNSDKLDQIIDCFTEYFGEKHRETITKRLKEATYLFLGEIGDKYSTKDSIGNYYNNKLTNILHEFNNKHKIYEDSASHLLFNKKMSEYISSKHKKDVPLDAYEETALLSVAISVSSKDLINDFKYNHIGFLDYVFANESEKLKEKFKELNKDWDKNYKKAFSQYQKVRELSTNVYGLKEKRVNQIKEDIKQKEEKILQEYLMKQNYLKTTIQDYEELKKYSDIYRDIIEKDPKFVTDYDKNRRIELFNFLGFDKSDSYEEYMKSDRVKNLLYDDNLKKEFEKLQKEEFDRICDSCIYIKHATEILAKNGYALTYDTGLKSAIKNFVLDNDFESGFVRFGLTQDLNLKAVCVLPQRLELSDETLIHEMTHIVTSNVYFNKENEKNFLVEGRAGIKEAGSIKYGFLDEVLNEIVAQEVCEIVKAKNIKVGDKEERSCFYTKGISTVKPFYKLNEENIKDNLIKGENDYFSKNYKEEFQQLDELLKIKYGKENIYEGVEELKSKLREKERREESKKVNSNTIKELKENEYSK